MLAQETMARALLQTPSQHTCPNFSNGASNIIGCGHTFTAEPDAEGWVDCPECGVAFSAARAADEAEHLAPRCITTGRHRDDGRGMCIHCDHAMPSGAA